MNTLSVKDQERIKRIGELLAKAAAHPSNDERIALWKSLNGLKPVRPMVMIDQLPWNELNGNGELNLECEDAFARSIENAALMTLYKWNHFRADMVIEPYLYIPMHIKNVSYGFTADEDVSVTDPTSSVVGHYFKDQLPDEEALSKLSAGRIGFDKALDKQRKDEYSHILKDIIPVRLSGTMQHCGVWDAITMARGAEEILIDIAERPEFTLMIVDKFVDMAMDMLDQFIANGLMTAGNGEIHCAGAYTDELPGYKENALPSEMWTMGLAQILGSVSPSMYEEFEIMPLKRLLDRYGLVYYGCCDPLHNKIDSIRKLKTVRKISMSPWADVKVGAQNMGGDYVLSRKPNPAFMTDFNLYRDDVKREIQETLDVCKQTGTPCEFILKDISTVSYHPEYLTEWEKLVMSLVGA